MHAADCQYTLRAYQDRVFQGAHDLPSLASDCLPPPSAPLIASPKLNPPFFCSSSTLAPSGFPSWSLSALLPPKAFFTNSIACLIAYLKFRFFVKCTVSRVERVVPSAKTRVPLASREHLCLTRRPLLTCIERQCLVRRPGVDNTRASYSISQVLLYTLTYVTLSPSFVTTAAQDRSS